MIARLEANLAAVRLVKVLQAEGRAATPAEQETLARWSGWGAVSAVFKEKPGESRSLTRGREQLRALLSDEEYAAARRNTINAHYTSPALAQAMWDGLAALGFRGGRVLEPGCGAGTFIGLAPLGTAMTGVELDPVTAGVAAALYPHAQVRNEDFAGTQLPEGSFDSVIGNVPFGDIHMTDPQHNPGRRHPIHTHFLLKSAALARPGALIALITSRYTMDGTGDDAVEARRKLAGLGELAAAVRLPSSAHRRTAGTDVVSDILVIRRFADGEQPPAGEPAWVQTVPVQVDGEQIPVNRYFAHHPRMVLGEMTLGGARNAVDLRVNAPAGTAVADSVAQALSEAAAERAATAPRPAAPAPAKGQPPEGFLRAMPNGTFARLADGMFEPFTPQGGAEGAEELAALLGMRDTALALLDAELATSEDAGPVAELRADLNARYDAYTARWGAVNRNTRHPALRDTPAGRELRERLLAEGHARITGGKVEVTDPETRDRLAAAGHAALTATKEVRFGRTAAARAERQRLLDCGQARVTGGSLTLTDAGREWLLDNAADLGDAVKVTQRRPAQGGFRNDPFAVRVLALEKFDPETGTARKTDIMRHRVLLPRPSVEHADDPEDALAICMDRHARVRLDVIAGLLGVDSEEEARDRLGALVFRDPAEGRLVPAPEYLSGDVRSKLRQAREAAEDDPACQANVEALTGVIPPDLGPAEIEARLGAVFITADEVQQFLRETLGDQRVTVTLGADGTWSVRGGDRHSNAATITWGTKARDAMSLAEHALNRGGPVKVTYKDAEGKVHTDEEATAAAREKQAELADRFSGWAWEDLDRTRQICRRYNDAFNSIVLRSYDEVVLTLPGVNRDIKPFWWQKAAIARMIYEPTAGLFHDMGAGKTLEQIIGVMEQKRLGLIRKPVICVKNHLLEQFRDEFLWAYPQARILCADTDELQGEGRRQFIARCASENPDAIIMTRGAFESIPLTPEGHEAYLGYMKRMFAVHAEAVTSTVKEEETLLTEFEQRLRAYFDPDAQDDKEDGEEDQDRKKGKRKIEQDPAVCWEAIGADYVCIDESQDYNNLWTPSEEPGMAIDFVHRSIDLEMKLHATRARYGDRVCTLATGTPITNKIPQFYVLQRYLRPERLEKAGFAGFAPWAATFTEPEQRLEKRADGSFGWVTRMRLINVPELLLDLHYFGDFKDADDIGMQRPAIRGGKPEIRGIAKVPELTAYYATLPERYNKAKGNSRAKEKKGLDTVVAVLGDGFRAAQDLRLVKARHGARPQLTDEPQKIDHIADDVYAEWLAHRDDAYPGDDGQPDPVKGSLQLVFCNEGVPKSDDWSLYEELRNLLAERGMPRQAIRFAHEAGTDRRKKARLFAACNAGHVAVLVGSTETMGVGTNVQRRCIGVHHVHPHWRPDYDAQEDARARRPGNLNPEVFIRKWITEGSFDTIRAQSCERKSVFLHVVKHRDPTVRSIEAPPDENRESYTEVAAVGAGEPLLIEKFQLESELQQLTRGRRRHLNNQNALKVAEQQARAAIAAAEQTLRDIDAAAGRIVPTAGDQFSMTVNGLTYTARRDAGEELVSRLRAARARVPDGTCETQTVGALGGFPLLADLARDGREHTIVLRLEHLPGAVLPFDHRKLPPGIGMVTRLENKLGGLDKLRAEQHAVIGRQQQELTQAQSAIGTPFPKQDALLATQKALDDIVTQLKGKGPGGAAATAPGPDGAQGSDGPAAGDRHGAGPVSSAQAGTSDGQHGRNPAPAQAPAAGGYRDAWTDALEVLRGSAGDLVPDAEQFADYFASRYGHQDPGTRPLVMQAYEQEWLPRQPADHPLKQQPPRADETGEPAPVAGDTAGLTPLPPEVPARTGSPQPGTVPTNTALLATGSSGGNGDARLPQPDSGPPRDLAARHDGPVLAAADPLPFPYQDSDEAQAARQTVFRALGRFRAEVPNAGRGDSAQWFFFRTVRGALSHPVSSELPEARRDWATAVDLAARALAEAGADQDDEGPVPALAREVAAHAARLSAYRAAAAQAAPYRDADAFAAGEADAEEAERAWLDTETGTWLRNLTGEQAHRGTLKDLRHAIQAVIGTFDAMTGFSGGPDDITLNQAVTRSEAAADASYALQLTLRLDQYRDDADRDLLREMTAAAALHADRTQATKKTAVDSTLTLAIPAARAARETTAGTVGRQSPGRDAAPQPSGTPAAQSSPEPGAGPAGTADKEATAPSAPAEPGTVPADATRPGPSDGTEQPGPGMTPAELNSVHQSAYEWGLRGIGNPDPGQQQRALDYAAWYLAEFGDEESMDDLPGHDHAWNWFTDRGGYPHRAPASTATGQPGQDQPGTEATAESAGPPGPSGPEPSAAGWSASRLRELAEAHRLGAVTGRPGGTLTVTVHDQERTVLVYDDLTGTITAGGSRLDPARVPAYLRAYASYPQLPPRCLHALARHEEPAPLTLTTARELAAGHGLEVRVRRISGQSYITFCEPRILGEYAGAGDIPAEPVLSYPAGSLSARHGPCAVPAAAIGAYLAAYRESVPPAMLGARGPYDWRSRFTLLTPYLVDGAGHFLPSVRDLVRAAITAGRDDRDDEADTLLAEAEALAPLVLTPEREAELAAVVRRETASHRDAEDPAAALAAAGRRTLDVTARELDWVRAYIAGNPEVREHAEDERAAAQASDREALSSLVAQAREALTSRDYERALALIDETELLYPDNPAECARARNQVHEAVRRSGAAPSQPAAATAAPEAAAQASPDTGADGLTGVPQQQNDQCAEAGDVQAPPAAIPGAAGEPGTTREPAGNAGDVAAHAPSVPRVTVLHGHTSPETAYLVGDYPYGRRLRCEKRYWLEVAAKGQYRGQVRLVTQTTNPKQPGRPWNKPHAEQYRAWSVMVLNQDGHVTLRSVSDWGPWGRDDAEIRLDGIYDQLDGEQRAAYDNLVELGRRGRNWDSWYDALGFIRGYQAEHGALPDAGQVQAAPGFYADEATSRTALAAVTAGLGGVHAGPGAPASPAAGTPAAAPPAKDGKPTDGTRPSSTAVPKDPRDEEPAPGQKFDGGGADFRYELAYAFALGSNPPGSAEDERARDFAAWYMARNGGREVGSEIPGHSFEWQRFAELGYPAPAPGAEQAEAGPVAPAREPVAAGSTSTEESAETPAAAPPEPAAADRDADGLGQPVPAGDLAETIPSGEPGLAGSARAAPEPGSSPGQVETDVPGRYSARIRVSSGSGPPVVSGTDYNNDPPELRETLRANGFEWQKRRQVWEYKGRRSDSRGPVEAARAIRALVARLDRESPVPTAKDFPPTAQQQAILDAFGDGKNIAVQALAGTGKTTTLVLLARVLLDRSPDARIVYTAFNSAIVDEARRGRFPRNVSPSTMHGLARQALLQTGYAAKIERGHKGARWPEQWAEVLGISAIPAAAPGDAPVSAEAVARLVIATVKKFRESADDEPGPQHLDVAAGSSLGKAALSYARAAWADISDPGNAKPLADGRALRVDHDDYLKVWALSRPRINASVIFFDEAQDVNQLMKAVILDQPAQTVVVGDSQQSIYGFRGAIDALKDWPADITLPLTQSWRFGPEAAEFGNLFLRSLGSALLLEGNPARATRLGSSAEPDAVLCRTNATAVAEVFAGLESGKRTALAGGGDAIAEIAKAARDLQASKGTKHPDLSRFTTWDEVRQYARDEEDGQSLQVFVRLIDRHGPGGLIDMIGRLTPEDDTKNPPQLTISTLHKAKGREWKAVRIAGDFRGPVTDPATGEVTWPSAEERRISYVAATRAMELLEPGSLSWIKDYPLPAVPGPQRPAQGEDRQAQAAAPDAPLRPVHPAAQPEPAGQEPEPAPRDSAQAAPATPRNSTTDGAPRQQHAPAPDTAEAQASYGSASDQATAAAGPDADQQDPAGGKEARPAAPGHAPGQASAAAGPGDAHADLPLPAAEPEPGEAPAEPPPDAEPGGERSPADGEPADARAAGTGDGAEPGEHPAAAVAARSDSGTAPAASLDAVGPPPEAGAAARLRALAEQHGLTVTAEQVSPTITVTTVTDGGRFVLRHDDYLGAAAEGTRIDLDEADAYLGAWRAYPGLPALALLDWVRRGPDDPAQLSLSAARAVAADCGLVAEPVRAAGQPFIVVRHPGLSGTVLACRPGDPAASAGPVTVPVPSVGTYLRLYQAAVKPHWLTALGKRGEWASQLTAMMPYLINGTSLHSAEACRHVDAAAHAAGTDDDRAVKDLLRRAWAAAGPFSPSPDREAVLLRVIADVAPRYQEITGDGPRYAAETAHASDPEWDWIYQHVRENPDILTTPTPTGDALEQRDAGERAQAEAEGNDLSAAAKAAFDAGDYPAALRLADQGETADPGRARRWEQIRSAIREKAAAAGQPPQTAIPEQSGTAAPEADKPPPQQAAAAAEPAAAGASSSADTGPGADDGARPGELSPLAVPAGHDESVRFLEELAARYGLRVSHVTDTLKWWTVHLSALDGGAGVPVAEYEGHTGKWSGFGAGRLDPSEVAAYLAARGEGDLHDAPAEPSDPYTRIGPARYDYHRALLAYQALRETKAGQSLMDIQDTDKPRPDAIALNAAYQAVSGGWKKAFAGDAEQVTVRFAAWEQTARVMARNLAAARHRAGIFRAALDVFTESAGHLASRTRATAEDPDAWASVFAGSPARTRAAGTAAAPPRPAPADETATDPRRGEPAVEAPVSRGAAPLRNMDLAAELDRMPGEVFARWLGMGATPPAAGDLDYRRQGEGSQATAGEDGIEITVSGPDVTRHGLVTWPQAASWIDRGVTPARLGIVGTADRLAAFTERHRDQLTAAGTCDPGAVAAELAQIRGAAIAAIVEAARRSRGTAVPVPPALPGDPAWHTAVPVTRPGSGPGRAENKALERLLALRSAVREPQPLTSQEVRDTIRREIHLADVARVMGNPAAMRKWISDQARCAPLGRYDDSGRTWRGSGRDGLTVDRHGDDRAPHVIAWGAVLAWVAPGLTDGLREELLAAAGASRALMYREFGAVINPGIQAGPPAEERDRAERRLRAAEDAAWAVILAAPPPSPADFDRARYAARDTSPVQDSLFGTGDVADGADAASAAPALPPAGQPGSPAPGPAEPGEPAPGTGEHAAAAQPEPAGRELPPSAADDVTTPGAQAPGQRHQDDDADRLGPNETPASPSREAPAQDSEAGPPTEPVSNTDLVIAMRHVQGGFLGVLTEGKTPDGGGTHSWRGDDEPDARASEDIDYDPRGVEITLRGREFRRHGRVSWAQIASWIDSGVTPARLGIILTAGRLRSAGAARGGLAVTGTGDFDAVMAELDRIREDGVNAVIDAALQAHGPAAPVPPAKRGGPAFYTTAIAAGPVESASNEENAALERLNQFRPLVCNPQPLTPQEVRTTIRRWIGDGLPAYAKALGDPAAMRAWVGAQVRGPARRSAGMTYSTPARPGGRWYWGEPEGLLTATDVEGRAQVRNLVPWEEIPAWVQPGLTSSLRARLIAAVPGKGDNEPGSLRDALDAGWAAIEAAPPPPPAELDDARHVYGGARPAQQALFSDAPPDGENTPRPATDSPARQGETPRTAAGREQGQPGALGQTAGSPGTQPDQGGQAPQGANTNNTQAPPAAASHEPSPDRHGDSQAGNDGTAAPQDQRPARDPEAAPGLPSSADSLAPGREAGPEPAAAQDAEAPGETATDGTAEAAQQQDIPPHPAVTDSDRTTATAADAADDGGDTDLAGNPGPGAGPSTDHPGSHPDTPPLGIPAPYPQAEPRQAEPPRAARATTPALPVGPFVPDGPAPLTDDDIVLGISRLPAFILGELFHAAGNGQPLGRAGYLLRSYSGERAAGEPDAGALETVTAVPAGLRIEVAAPGGRRAGLVTLQQAVDLLRPGATPARRQIVTRAWQAGISFTSADSSFHAVGEGRLAAAARDELTAIADTVVATILEAVRPAGFSQPADEAAMTRRIAELTASLPAQQPRPRAPAAEVTPGDVIGHYSYRFHPFLVAEAPRQAGDIVEITGRLTEPEPDEPAGPFTLTVPPAGRQGAVVTVIPVPARSLRPLFPGHQLTAGAGQPAALPEPGENTEAPSVPNTAPADEPQPPQPRNQEETMPPAAPSAPTPTPPPAAEEPGAVPQAPPAPATASPRPATGRIRYGDPARSRSHAEAPGGGADGASLTEELEQLLAALRERGAGADGSDFSDIRASFAAVRNALSLPAASQETGPAQPAPALLPYPEPAPDAASQPPRGKPGPAADDFSDIRETFADLRDILGLPASGRHARGDGPPDDADAAVARALDQAAAEAKACARWYRDTPEWQRTMTVGRAVRDLVTAIRDAAGDCWGEIRQDIRVRGFARTLAARTALAVAGPAHLLAAGLERAGFQGSRPWRAAWGLHRAATTFASRVMRYDPPGSPDRMRDARRIIAGLAQRQNSPAQPGPGRHAAPRGANGTRAPNAADLAGASFPVTVSRGNARQAAAAPAARTSVAAPRPHASRRQ